MKCHARLLKSVFIYVHVMCCVAVIDFFKSMAQGPHCLDALTPIDSFQLDVLANSTVRFKRVELR